jgi:thiol-disulfide isomerase/thioredoxin
MKRIMTSVWSFVLLTTVASVLPLAAAPEGATKGKSAPKADVQMVDRAGLKKALAAQKGKVVLVNLWATWCAPCVEEFPDLVKLDEKLRSKGLVVIGVSLDEPRDGDKVVEFITKQKAAFPVYLRKGGDSDSFVEPVDKSWTGAVPTTFIFDRSGKRVGKPLIGGRSYAAFAAAVEPLLK